MSSVTDADASDQPPAPSRSARRAAWGWIPTLYFASGLPYVVVVSMATAMYKSLGVSNTLNAAYTSALLSPWTFKPLWSPLVELIGTQRRWIIAAQALIAAGLFAIAAAAPAENFLMLTLAGFWLLAIASATHDIAADGFYMASMPERDQAWFVGIRSTFYRLSMIVGSGLLVTLAGDLASGLQLTARAIGRVLGTGAEEAFKTLLGSVSQGMPIGEAWSLVFYAIATLFLVFTLYHQVILPRPAAPQRSSGRTARSIVAEFFDTFVSFFRKPGIVASLAYLLIYRFSEGQLAKMKAPFLLDPREEGGLGLSLQTLGLLDGTIGIALLTIGGIVGGLIVARDGLRRWFFPMALAINLPNAAYVYLGAAQPESIAAIGTAIAVEQFGYGFGFAGYMLYMLQLSRGEHQTAHYALCTGFMSLGMQIPMGFSGAIQEWLGYERFFYWVLAATIPSLIITLLAPLRDSETNG
ncbi:MFS transporter [Botrimarina hoheduenensis]|uniref:Muropeptide transporter n=1 Tax=Botrimarina hoheduenensis TaxID=2528000 RepID=A0A5C5VQA9_9BACT|nr:MFS transporter [Botrimarina hoheduenensis]TWT40816.1 muropeptide transporter [Botrimarina hoheduenensis]